MYVITFNIPYKYIALEYCNNGNLDNYAKFNNKYNIINIISQIFNGLFYLYKKHIVHLDLTPANIFVHKIDNDIFKIGDFGLSKLDTNISIAVLKLGTKLYKPPIKVSKNILYYIDLYAFFCNIFYLYERIYYNNDIDRRKAIINTDNEILDKIICVLMQLQTDINNLATDINIYDFYTKYYEEIATNLTHIQRNIVYHSGKNTVYKIWLYNDLIEITYNTINLPDKFFNTLNTYYNVHKFNFFKTILEISTDENFIFENQIQRTLFTTDTYKFWFDFFDSILFTADNNINYMDDIINIFLAEVNNNLIGFIIIMLIMYFIYINDTYHYSSLNDLFNIIIEKISIEKFKLLLLKPKFNTDMLTDIIEYFANPTDEMYYILKKTYFPDQYNLYTASIGLQSHNSDTDKGRQAGVGSEFNMTVTTKVTRSLNCANKKKPNLCQPNIHMREILSKINFIQL